MEGLIVKVLPDVAFVRVTMGGEPEDDLARNKACKSVTSMFEQECLDET
jgi:hypothetical protein